MFSVGELIVYRGAGVCRVEEIGPPPCSPGERRDYYTLVPLHSRETIYVPVESRVFMRPILTRGEAEALIDRLPEIRQAQVEGRDYRALAQQYREYLGSRRCEDLVPLLKGLYEKGRRQSRAGKKPGKVDQDVQRRAEALLHGELPAALEIPPEQVPEYIRRRLAPREAAQG